MLAKELEILKQIEELYSGDITEEAFLELCKGKETKLQAWKEAFAEYPLFEVSKAINHFYMRKSSKTRPNIAQLTAILQETNATREIADVPVEKVECSFGMKYMRQDSETGDMSWLVPHYQQVEALIRQDYYPFVQNIYHPTYDEFRECMKRWCSEVYGRDYFVESKNQFEALPYEERQAKHRQNVEIVETFKLKRLN